MSRTTLSYLLYKLIVVLLLGFALAMVIAAIRSDWLGWWLTGGIGGFWLGYLFARWRHQAAGGRSAAE